MAKRISIHTPWSDSYTDNTQHAINIAKAQIKSLAEYDVMTLHIGREQKIIAEIQIKDGVLISNLHGCFHKHNKRDTYKLIEGFLIDEMEGNHG